MMACSDIAPHPSQPGTSARRTPASVIFDNPDIVGVILRHAELGPAAFVAAARVSKAWYAACHADTDLLLAAARRYRYLTKRTMMDLFALSWREADKLPRGKSPRRNGGFLYMYCTAAIDRALLMVGGLEGWKQRLAKRAEREKASREALASERRARAILSGR